MAKAKKSNTGFRNDKLFCYNCGESQVIPFPMPIKLTTDFFKSFDLLHKNCKKTWVEPVANPDTEPTEEAICKNAKWWLENGERGLSSKFIYSTLSGNNKQGGASCPYDPADFRRCYLLFKAVPQWRTGHYMNILSQTHPVWAKLVENWDILTTMYEEKNEKMYEFMQTLLSNK